MNPRDLAGCIAECPAGPHQHSYCAQCAGYHESAACPGQVNSIVATRTRPDNTDVEPLTARWRFQHAEKGQEILDLLDSLIEGIGPMLDDQDCQRIQALVAVAQTHFAAAALNMQMPLDTNRSWPGLR